MLCSTSPLPFPGTITTRSLVMWIRNFHWKSWNVLHVYIRCKEKKPFGQLIQAHKQRTYYLMVSIGSECKIAAMIKSKKKKKNRLTCMDGNGTFITQFLWISFSTQVRESRNVLGPGFHAGDSKYWIPNTLPVEFGFRVSWAIFRILNGQDSGIWILLHSINSELNFNTYKTDLLKRSFLQYTNAPSSGSRMMTVPKRHHISALWKLLASISFLISRRDNRALSFKLSS